MMPIMFRQTSISEPYRPGTNVWWNSSRHPNESVIIKVKSIFTEADIPCLVNDFNQRNASRPNIGICKRFCSVGSRHVRNSTWSLFFCIGIDDEMNIRPMRKMGGMSGEKNIFLFMINNGLWAAPGVWLQRKGVSSKALSFSDTWGLRGSNWVILQTGRDDIDRQAERVQSPSAS